ncbi:MAG: SGNH/GDSL hydrolase family protein, partial [Armatimonadota bacterium]
MGLSSGRVILHRLIGMAVACGLSVLLPAADVSPAAPVKPFQSGDRVAFVGDSITHWGAYAYMVAAFYQTRFPERKIYWGYFGRSGSTAAFWSREPGLDDPHPEWPNLRKLLAFRPTVVTVMLGMNDSGYDDVWLLPDEKKVARIAQLKAAYEKNMDSLIARLKDAGVKRIILIIPTPYDEVHITDPKWKPLSGKNRFIKDVIGAYLVRKSKELGEPVIDFFTPMLRVNQIEQKIDPKFSVIDLGDRIHPGRVGHFIMGYMFLKAQRLEGKVSEIAISASRSRVLSHSNCEITGLRVCDGVARVVWRCRSNSLPFPPGVPGLAEYRANKGKGWARHVPFDDEFNQEIIR